MRLKTNDGYAFVFVFAEQGEINAIWKRFAISRQQHGMCLCVSRCLRVRRHTTRKRHHVIKFKWLMDGGNVIYVKHTRTFLWKFPPVSSQHLCPCDNRRRPSTPTTILWPRGVVDTTGPGRYGSNANKTTIIRKSTPTTRHTHINKKKSRHNVLPALEPVRQILGTHSFWCDMRLSALTD